MCGEDTLVEGRGWQQALPYGSCHLAVQGSSHDEDPAWEEQL
jgi:hypothetical protein